MRRHAAALLFAVAALLLTPGAAGLPNVPGDPTPPVVTPVITGTLGLNGWYTTNVTVNWSVTDPESIILSTSGCNAVTFTSNTTGTPLTCTAESDGGTTTVSKTFKVDKTAPATTATPSRAADSNGWYNHDLSVDFNGSDTTSGLESCSPDATYGGPDTSGTTVAGTCRDLAGNTAPATLPLKYDETAPQSSPAARPPDANGWHNHAVTVTFQGTDGTSGVATCTQTTYSGPDDPSVALSGTCVDQAGNQSPSALFTTKYDETPPQATAAASRPADVNGWHNHPLTVSYSGSDATSGLASCDPTESYAGPDSASASISGACRDLAGNVAPRSVVVKYDATAPQVTMTPGRAANAAGWYNAPLAVTFAGTDPMSGLASCVQPQNYSGPDNATAAVSGSCSDQAGNVRNASFGLKYDATAPQTTASPGRPADENGWYNHALSVTFAGTDATSGIGSCDAAKTYSTPDTATASLGGTCRDQAGNQSAAATYGFKYDATSPSVTAAPSRPPNANGWYRAPLTVGFSGGDATSGVSSCEAAKSYGGPDAVAASVGGTCRDQAGNTGTASFALKYDASAPQASAAASRAPNANGWFNAPLSVSFAGTDTTSGLESCPAAQNYSGPDSGTASISGTCLDKAGNAVTASLALKYDATPPQTTAAPSRQPNAAGWYTAPLTVGFSATDATSTVDSCDTAKSYSGPDIVSTTVAGTCRDKAGNSNAASFALKYDATAPAASATPSRQPNAAGWYRAPLTVSFAATDATSGLASCPAPKDYAGPDNATASVGGTCLDVAGNAATPSLLLKYDATAPQASATASRPADFGGWFNHALTVNFAATDATSGLASCPAPKSYSGPDDAAASVGGTCLDVAGNAATPSLTLKYDATAPQADGDADASGQRERLVQRAGPGRLRRHRRNGRRGLVRGAEDVLGPGQRARRSRRKLPGPGREHGRDVVRAQVRRDRAADDGDAGPGSRLERLVQGRAHGQLRRHGRDSRNRVLRRAQELLRPRQRRRLRQRLLPRPGRQQRGPLLRARVRRDGAPGDRSEPRPPDGCKRLVQPPGRGGLRGHGRHVRHRSGRLHPGDVRRAGQRRGLRQRHLQRPGRQPERDERLRPQVRRDGTGGERRRRTPRGRERLVQPLADRQLHGLGRDLWAPVLPGAEALRRSRQLNGGR